jgi:hypothetical protein
LSRFEQKLNDANIRKTDVKAIIVNLEKLEKSGISKADMEIVVHNIIKDSGFRSAFIQDPQAALRKIRHESGSGI